MIKPSQSSSTSFSKGTLDSQGQNQFEIYNATMLVGPELEFVKNGHITLKDGLIHSIDYSASTSNKNNMSTRLEHIAAGRGKSRRSQNPRFFDGSGLLIIPAFVNAHTHIGDSIGKDLASSAGLDSRVHPVFGIKRKILEKTPLHQLKSYIRYSAISMLGKGIVTFADFREGGLNGVMLLREALKGLPIKCIALGRIERYQTPSLGTDATQVHPKHDDHTLDQEIDDVLLASDGLGISGANEHTDDILGRYRRAVDRARTSEPEKSIKVAIHAAESTQTVLTSKEMTGKSEVERAVEFLEPDILIHMTNASEAELAASAEREIGIVACPRANAVLGVGIPKVSLMLELDCTVALGTDNVMLNSPDMFREMDFIWKVSRVSERRKELLDAREVLKMATVNGAKVLGVNTGCIEPGRAADLLFIDMNHIDLSPMHDPYTALVQRANSDCIKGVMANGQFVELISNDL